MTDTQAYNVISAHITQTPGICGGEPCIAGRRIKVRHIYVWYDLMGMTDDQIAERYDLSLAEIHAALTYAFDHLDEIRQAIHQEDEFVETLFKDHPSKLPSTLVDDDDED